MAKLQQYFLGLLMLCSMVCTVEAVETGSIYIDYHYEESPLPQVGYQVYQLYKLDTAGNYAPCTQYEDLGELEDFVDNDTWLKQTQVAENFINVNGISPDQKGETNEMGRAVIEDLKEGIYLVNFDKKTLEDVSYLADSVMLMVPGSLENDEEWVQTIIPKVSSYDDPQEAEKQFDIFVLKYWREDNAEVRPQDISIALYKDGKLEDTVVLSASNEWHYHWEDVDPDATWGVEEVEIPYHYKAEVTFDEYSLMTVFHVENTYVTQIGSGSSVGVGGGQVVEGDGYDTDVEGEDYENQKDDEDEDEIPETGAMYVHVPVLILSGMVLITVGLHLRKDKHEKTNR